MSTFQLQKNQTVIKVTVLTNIVKMLIERGLLTKEKGATDMEKFSKAKELDTVYQIHTNDKKTIVKILPHKITAISKSFGLRLFLEKYPDAHKIVVVNDMSKKAVQFIIHNYADTEIFNERDLMLNLIDHVDIPKHIPMSEAEKEDFFKKYNCTTKQVPKMKDSEPVSRYYNLRPGTLVKVLRPSETGGIVPFYRLVKKDMY
jgi:DNA-directed RNA polymerase subunit H (RpoH/RPB5)